MPEKPVEITPEEMKGLFADEPPSVEVAPEMVADYPTEKKRQRLLEFIETAKPEIIDNLWRDLMGENAVP